MPAEFKGKQRMPDPTTTVSALREAMRRFVTERDWEQFHSPKNLAMGLSVEAAELMEHFLWVSNEESCDVARDPARLGEVADEMADVALYLLALSNTLDIDLSDAITSKLAKTALKYPIERCRGRHSLDPAQ
jgi:NTP pyrophosphatase (non-canonical NTP hydrolase)